MCDKTKPVWMKSTLDSNNIEYKKSFYSAEEQAYIQKQKDKRTYESEDNSDQMRKMMEEKPRVKSEAQKLKQIQDLLRRKSK
jgi:hypothetical protein